MFKFIQMINGKEVLSQREKSATVIYSCFEYCDLSVRKQVKDLLDSDCKKSKIVIDDEETVILERV